MALYVLPVDSSSTYYEFDTRIDGESYRVTLRWNPVSQTWYLDLVGLTNSVNLLGLALIVGSDLLAPFAILELGSMYVLDIENLGENPTEDSLGDRHRVVMLSRGDDPLNLLEALE